MRGLPHGRTGDVIAGVVAIIVALGLLTVAYLAYDRALVPSKTVTLKTDVVGNALRTGSDVKLNGVPIGVVSKIDATEDKAELSLALDPDVMHLLPDNVVARLLPKTLFGERYVDLVDPPHPDSTRLQAGDVIYKDTSAQAAELQQVLNAMLPVLQAIQPGKLDAMMGEFAQMLRGNGGRIGDAMATWSHYLKKMQPLVPQMADDLARFGRVASDWNIAAPDLIDALSTMTTSAKTLVDEQTQLRSVYASVIGSADSTRGWVSKNEDTIVVLSKQSRAALRATAPYATEFPCLFKAVRKFIPKMERTLGKGTDEPGMHSVLQVVPVRQKYLSSALHYTHGTPPPRCPYVTGQVGTKPADRVSVPGSAGDWPQSSADATVARSRDGEPAPISAPPGVSVQTFETALSGLGDANSPAENELIAELVGPTQGIAPSQYPDWNSLLLGPTLRGTGVILK